MEERDAKPFESVQTALSLFEKRERYNSCNSSENGYNQRKEKEVDFLLKELAICKVQLEINESAGKQTALKLEVYRRTVDDLSAQLKISDAEIDKYKDECQQAQTRIAQLQSENKAIAKLLLESGEHQRESLAATDELKTLKEELLLMRAEVTAAEKSKIMEEELSKKPLGQTSAANESTPSSLVATVEADVERSASFGMEAELHNAKEALPRCYFNLTDDLETELLAKIIQAHYFQSELAQAKELSHKVPEHASYLALMEAEQKKMQEELLSERDKANDLHCQVEAFSTKMQAMQHEMFEMKGRELEFGAEIVALKADLQESRSRIAAESTEAKRSGDMLKEELEAAKSEINGLRLNLEEATKRAELAEKAKAAVEDQLRKWREQQKQRRTSADSIPEQSMRKDTCSGNHSFCLPPLNKSTARAAALHGGTSSPVCEKTGSDYVPLAKVLNMKL